MIALAGPILPHEVLIAAGVHGGALVFQPDREIRTAGKWLENKFMPWAPAVLEAWHRGTYDALDAVLFSRADDTSQRLYYYICELKRRGALAGPEPLIFDAALIQRGSSLDHTIAQVRAFAQRLGVNDEALQNAIVQTNERRSQSSSANGAPLCLLNGSPPPDRRLHEAIECAGFAASGPTLADSWTALGEPIEHDLADPAAAIGHQLHARCEGSRTFTDRGAEITRQAKRRGFRAVVTWLAEEDETRSWSLPQERLAVERLGLPHLVMTRRDWLGRDGAAGEITQFLEGISQ